MWTSVPGGAAQEDSASDHAATGWRTPTQRSYPPARCWPLRLVHSRREVHLVGPLLGGLWQLLGWLSPAVT
jgi:hypothetical protein